MSYCISSLRCLPGPSIMFFKGVYIKVLRAVPQKRMFGRGNCRWTVGDNVSFLKPRKCCMCCLIKGMAAGTRRSEYSRRQDCDVVQYV